MAEIDTSDLPAELIAQLSKRYSKPTKEQIALNAMRALGGQGDIDQMLVTVYRHTNEIWKRSEMNAVLFRLEKRGTIMKHARVYWLSGERARTEPEGGNG
ncbi:hypothetical protein K6V90_09585 [Cupriavidus pauculus]|uniref:hypothetical protein n=1 Tax=Cupriavidus pauculus TaxID=82633 RepID=UPI001C931E73|nr:hypothetical protein [Cupriavidus pauculus]MBY4730783.1 hypothetical protein [Cupriavidus pauculus]